jgi:tRNA dimethylallyltransferase
MPENDTAPKIPLLILAGPTAAGKSSLALELARALNTDIISADSAQVYRGLDIGTAKPSPEEQNKVKHHLIDLVNPDQEYSVAGYRKEADRVIQTLWSRGKLPFMVGGTGLYISAVACQYAFGSKGANAGLRAAFEEEANEAGLEKLFTRLKTVDPEAAAKIHPNDQRRIIRALEVYELEGKPISGQVIKTENSQSPYRLYYYVLNRERDMLYSRIEKRVDLMMQQGFLEEVHGLLKSGYSADAPGMMILGYRQLTEHLKGYISLEAAVTEIKKQTRNLAKRQLTWFRRETDVEWIMINDHSSVNSIKENICIKVKDITP